MAEFILLVLQCIIPLLVAPPRDVDGTCTYLPQPPALVITRAIVHAVTALWLAGLMVVPLAMTYHASVRSAANVAFADDHASAALNARSDDGEASPPTSSSDADNVVVVSLAPPSSAPTGDGKGKLSPRSPARDHDKISERERKDTAPAEADGSRQVTNARSGAPLASFSHASFLAPGAPHTHGRAGTSERDVAVNVSCTSHDMFAEAVLSTLGMHPSRGPRTHQQGDGGGNGALSSRSQVTFSDYARTRTNAAGVATADAQPPGGHMSSRSQMSLVQFLRGGGSTAQPQQQQHLQHTQAANERSNSAAQAQPRVCLWSSSQASFTDVVQDALDHGQLQGPQQQQQGPKPPTAAKSSRNGGTAQLPLGNNGEGDGGSEAGDEVGGMPLFNIAEDSIMDVLPGTHTTLPQGSAKANNARAACVDSAEGGARLTVGASADLDLYAPSVEEVPRVAYHRPRLVSAGGSALEGFEKFKAANQLQSGMSWSSSAFSWALWRASEAQRLTQSASVLILCIQVSARVLWLSAGCMCAHPVVHAWLSRTIAAFATKLSVLASHFHTRQFASFSGPVSCGPSIGPVVGHVCRLRMTPRFLQPTHTVLSISHVALSAHPFSRSWLPPSHLAPWRSRWTRTTCMRITMECSSCRPSPS